MRRATIACSSRSLALLRSCSPRWSSTAGSALRRVVPASATVWARWPSRRTSSSGLAPTKAASGRAHAPAVAGREQLAERPEHRRRGRARAARGRAPRARARPSRARRRGCARPRAPPPARSATAARRWRRGCAPPDPGRAAASAAARELAHPLAKPLDHRVGVVIGLNDSGEGHAGFAAPAARAPSPAAPGTRAAGRSTRATTPPSSANAKPPTNTGPAAGGRDRIVRRVVGESVRAPSSRAARRHLGEPPGAARLEHSRLAEPGEDEAVAVGLLEAGKAVVGAPGRQNGGTEVELGRSIGTVTAATATGPVRRTSARARFTRFRSRSSAAGSSVKARSSGVTRMLTA